jgi:hypothetical protein
MLPGPTQVLGIASGDTTREGSDPEGRVVHAHRARCLHTSTRIRPNGSQKMMTS